MTDVPTRKRLSRAERRSVLLRTATRLFAESGYQGVSLDEVASASGVTKPVLYDHFASKEALYLAVLDGVRAGLLEVAGQAVQTQGPPERRVRAAVTGFFTHIQRHPQAIRVLLVPSGEATAERVAARIQEEVTEHLVELFQALLPGPLPPQEADRVRLHLEFIKQGLHGLAVWWPAHPEVSTDQLTDSVMAVIWSGLAQLFPAATS